MLLDLAERAAPVVVAGRAGRRHRGTLRAVGRDFCGLRTPEGADVLLTYGGVASVRSEGRAEVVAGDRPVALDVGLAEALAALAADRPRVLVVTMADAEGVAGELRGVGADVLTLRLDGLGRPNAYVPIAVDRRGPLGVMDGLVLVADRLGVEVLQRSGLDPVVIDEGVDLVLLQSDDPPEAVGGDVTLVDEAVQGPGRDAEPLRGRGGREPGDLGGTHHRKAYVKSEPLSILPVKSSGYQEERPWLHRTPATWC